jgi:hypothetical protein
VEGALGWGPVISAIAVGVVDYVSFDEMRREQLRVAFGFESHFSEQGFQTIP